MTTETLKTGFGGFGGTSHNPFSGNDEEHEAAKTAGDPEDGAPGNVRNERAANP